MNAQVIQRLRTLKENSTRGNRWSLKQDVLLLKQIHAGVPQSKCTVAGHDGRTAARKRIQKLCVSLPGIVNSVRDDRLDNTIRVEEEKYASVLLDAEVSYYIRNVMYILSQTLDSHTLTVIADPTTHLDTSGMHSTQVIAALKVINRSISACTWSLREDTLLVRKALITKTNGMQIQIPSRRSDPSQPTEAPYERLQQYTPSVHPQRPNPRPHNARPS